MPATRKKESGTSSVATCPVCRAYVVQPSEDICSKCRRNGCAKPEEKLTDIQHKTLFELWRTKQKFADTATERGRLARAVDRGWAMAISINGGSACYTITERGCRAAGFPIPLPPVVRPQLKPLKAMATYPTQAGTGTHTVRIIVQRDGHAYEETVRVNSAGRGSPVLDLATATFTDAWTRSYADGRHMTLTDGNGQQLALTPELFAPNAVAAYLRSLIVGLIVEKFEPAAADE